MITAIDATEYMNRGIKFDQQGKNEKALLNYNTAIKLNPKNTAMYYNRVILLGEQGEKEKALQDYNMAIKLNPNYAQTYSNRGILFKQKGDHKNALEDYNMAIKLNLNDADPYSNRGILFHQQGENEKALQDYDMAIRLNPNHADTYYNRGILFNLQGEHEKALQDYNKGLQLEPDNPLLLKNLGSLFFKQKQFDQANIYFTKTQKSLDQITNQQLSKWSLSYLDLINIQQELNLLIMIQIQVQITDIQLNYLSKEIQIQKTIQLKEQAQILVNELTQQIKPLDTYLNQNLQTVYFQILEKFEERFNDFQNQINTLVNSFLEQDKFKVSESLKQLNKKENKNQQIFHQPILNQQKWHNRSSKDVNYRIIDLWTITYCWKCFYHNYAALDFGFENHKEHKFTRRLRKLNNILKCSSIVPGQLQIEIQIASLELSKDQQANLIYKPKSRFIKFADQLLQEEDKEFRDNIYLAAGSEDALIILNYLEANSDMIINEIFSKKVLLRQIIIQAIKEQYQLSENKHIQQKGNENENKVKVADKSSLCIVQ
ncbi:unnamed protein product [Paramecium pentaurelia]|uniref:Tetratricopeptide repeat protein n=1 Tax=Paramecium pentaurelia TaxID=43138 RepID=A0A8S1W7E7_9CILI|nr:unnamed protein product [Paramecium pentaurelia]